MAVKKCDIYDHNGKMLFLTWNSMNKGDVGVAFPLTDYCVRSISVKGILDGAAVFIYGSNDFKDDLAFYPLLDTVGNIVCFSLPGMLNVSSECFRICPRIDGGTVNTDIIVTALLKKC